MNPQCVCQNAVSRIHKCRLDGGNSELLNVPSRLNLTHHPPGTDMKTFNVLMERGGGERGGVEEVEKKK